MPACTAGACYQEVVEQLAARALEISAAQTNKKRTLIGIAGAPGSGKSTLASLATRCINNLASQQNTASPSEHQSGLEVAVQLPMDGFHYYKTQLDVMPDPKQTLVPGPDCTQEAYARRGAHWTFDAEAFVRCIHAIRELDEVQAPSFDHGVGDPVEHDIHVKKHHRIVLVEGNYVLLDIKPWNELKQLFDDTWFVDVDLDIAMERVLQRQVAIGLKPEESRDRIAGNDRPNGVLVNGSKVHANVLVPSDIPMLHTE